MTFELKEQVLNAFASQLYSDLIVSWVLLVIPFSENKRRTGERSRNDERAYHQNHWQPTDIDPERPR